MSHKFLFLNSVVIQPDNLTIEKDDQVNPRWYQIVYEPHWLDGEQSPHHSDLHELCTIKEAQGVELDADDDDDDSSTVTDHPYYPWSSRIVPSYRSYSERRVNLTGRAIVGIGIRNIDHYLSGDAESHFKFKIYACDQD